LDHGGNLFEVSKRLNISPSKFIDASASLYHSFPYHALAFAVLGSCHSPYPDRDYSELRCLLGSFHGVDPSFILVGNGASELITWAARDASSLGASTLPQPGFSDYIRALNCWGGNYYYSYLDLSKSSSRPTDFTLPVHTPVLWVTNPHNPTGQLWTKSSLERYLDQVSLLICDESFLGLVPEGSLQSLIPLAEAYPNLVVIRSFTKLFSIAGMRLGYVIANPERLSQWSSLRDPWPVNSIANALGCYFLRNQRRYRSWEHRVQAWTLSEGHWFLQRLPLIPGISVLPSAANFILAYSSVSLPPVFQALENRHHIILRDCSSFPGLGPNWMRIGFQNRARNRVIIEALALELSLSKKLFYL